MKVTLHGEGDTGLEKIVLASHDAVDSVVIEWQGRRYSITQALGDPENGIEVWPAVGNASVRISPEEVRVVKG